MERPTRRPAREALMTRGIASEFIEPFVNAKPGERAVLLLRVSSSQQSKRRNLKNQRVVLTQAAEERGVPVVGVLEFEWSGYKDEWRDKLFDIAEEARRLDADILLATNTDRFIRSRWYKSNHKIFWKAQAQVNDLIELDWSINGICRVDKSKKLLRIMTLHDPDAPPQEYRKSDTKTGQRVKDRKGGHPIMRRGPGRPAHLPIIVEFMRDLLWNTEEMRSEELCQRVMSRFACSESSYRAARKELKVHSRKMGGTDARWMSYLE